jgi:CubicO group peptidase (beta-lactamase class C family)
MTSRSRGLAAAALIVSASLPAPLAQQRQGLAPAASTRIEAAIAAAMDRMHIPALSVAIVNGNELQFNRAYGTTDIENGVKALPVTVFRIASTSKPLTAVAAMQLVDRGALDLDAPVQKYVPAFPEKPFPVTTRHLLAHLSGIRHYRAGEGERTDRFDSLTDALRIFKDDPLEHEPGARYTYSTFGYTLLGAVIEGAARMPYEAYLRQHILDPAGMTRTCVDDIFALVPNRARGYTPRVFAVFDGEYRNASLMDPSYKIPGGGLLSTAEDLVRFAIGLHRGTLLSRESLGLMAMPQSTRDGATTPYGLGWYAGPRAGFKPGESMWHGGVQAGFTSELWLVPSRGFAVAILANLEGGGRLGLAALADEIAAIALAGVSGPAADRAAGFGVRDTLVRSVR